MGSYVFTDHIGLSSRGLTRGPGEPVMPHPACSPMTSGTRHDARVHEVTAREAPGSTRPAGAFASGGFGVRRWRWGIAVAIAGTVLGATRFVGENVANLLLLALVVAGLAALARWVGGEPGLGGAVMLFVAAGLVHWTFLAVVGAILALAALMAVPASRRAAAAGVPLI